MKLECALALPLFEGGEISAAAAMPQAPPTAFSLLSDAEKLTFIGAVMEEIEATAAANQLATPTSAAPTITKPATIPQELNAGKLAYLAAQRAKFGGFRPRG